MNHRSDHERLVGRIMWIVIFFCQAPLLLVHFRRLWMYEHYQYFPFVLVAFALFLKNRWPHFGTRRDRGKSTVERFLLATGLMLLGISFLFWSSWLAAVAAISTAGAAILHFSGRQSMTRLLPVWLLLFLLVPIPFRGDVQLIFWMQTMTSQAGSRMLDFLGIAHLLAGHVIEVPGRSFMTEEACSGIQSLFSIISFTAMLLLLVDRSWIHSTCLLLSAIVWAGLANIVRVATVVAAHAWYQIDLSSGWKHETLGLCMFAFALACLVSTDQLLRFLLIFPPRHGEHETGASASDDSQSTEIETKSESFPKRSTSVGLGVVTGVFVLLGLGQFAALAFKLESFRIVGETTKQLENTFRESTLPAESGEWQLINFEKETRSLTNNLGRYSASWTYRTENATALIQINYPFVDWHHLQDCYQAYGWKVESDDEIMVESKDGKQRAIWRLGLSRTSGEWANVFFSEFDNNGHGVQPPKAGWFLATASRLFRYHPFKRMPNMGTPSTTYQIQVFVPSDGALSKTQEAQIQELFLTSSERVRREVADAIRGKTAQSKSK